MVTLAVPMSSGNQKRKRCVVRPQPQNGSRGMQPPFLTKVLLDGAEATTSLPRHWSLKEMGDPDMALQVHGELVFVLGSWVFEGQTGVVYRVHG